MKRWQIGMRTLLLLAAEFAVWIAFIKHRAEIARLKPQIESMRSIARELVVADESKVSAVKHSELWIDDDHWDVYLPDGGYRLNLATRQIAGKGTVPPLKTVQISHGKREIALEQKQVGETWHFTISLDGREVIKTIEQKDWNSGTGWIEGEGVFTSRQFDEQEPVVLYRRRLMLRTGTTSSSMLSEPRNGILLWIDKSK
ncbi:hypothetical protein [Singulisphaera sp. PoT]|uniref:hypothetical protein n=1 Tax=Singulisphaera sp. PoT TaxID=3411797 RepID=UPI003BF5D88D